jgi:hypothetical protein
MLKPNPPCLPQLWSSSFSIHLGLLPYRGPLCLLLQLLALVAQVLLRVLELQALETQRQLHAVRVRARPRPQQLQRQDDDGLRQRATAVDEHRHLLVHGVEAQQLLLHALCTPTRAPCTTAQCRTDSLSPSIHGSTASDRPGCDTM